MRPLKGDDILEIRIQKAHSFMPLVVTDGHLQKQRGPPAINSRP